MESGYSSEHPVKEMNGAFKMISRMQQMESSAYNLNVGLSASQRSDVLALTTLIETKLLPALLYATWCEPDAYSKHTRAAYGQSLDFPLNYWLPYVARRNMFDAYKYCLNDGQSLHDDACSVLDALTSRLLETPIYQGKDINFLVSSRPTSLDALAFTCLAHIKAAPVVYPSLRKKFNESSALRVYVSRISERYFSISIPDASGANLDWWSREVRADAAHESSDRPSFSALDLKGKLWLAGAAAAMAAYILFSGEYFQIALEDGDLGDGDEEEEE